MRKRWPRSYRAGEVYGDGRYAVLTCPYRHPSARRMMYSEVRLFQTEAEAIDYKRRMDNDPYRGLCHAVTKGRCNHDHELVDLATLHLRVD